MKKILFLSGLFVFVYSGICAQLNLLPNGGFEEGLTYWVASAGGTSQANTSITSDNPASGDSCLQVEVVQLGSNYWDIQVQNFSFGLEEGKGYRISLKAKASSSDIMMNYIIGKATSPYTYYSENRNFELTEEWVEYTFSFTSPVSSEDDVVASLQFVSLGTVWVDDVKIANASVNDIHVNASGNTIDIEFVDEMEDPALEPQITFFAEVNAEKTIQVTSVQQDNSNLRIFTLHLEETIYAGETVTLHYYPGTIATRGGIEIDAFSIPATNNSTQVPTGINNPEISDYKLYPVPAIDILYLENKTGYPDCSVEVYDLSGKRLISETHSGQARTGIQIESLQSGLYILRILNADNHMIGHQKFIKH
ncbi:MAG: carbohydrate binding domain-containing protein [Bacteroidales bacterium]|nr:carbohydrate binding domain-containing protein [Bacteroidales bacterium]